MRRNPKEYYDFISRPRLARVAEVAGLRTAAEYAHEYDSESDVIDLFEAGINDVIPPLTAITKKHPELTQEQAFTIMSNDVTVATVGLLASMGEVGLHRLYDEDKEIFSLSDDRDAIILTHSIEPSPYGGCRAVNVREGHPEMTPMFRKFVPWAGSLAVLAHFEYHEL